MTETTIENWIVIDYKNKATRTRKSEPSATELGKNEIVTRLGIDVVVPEPEVEPVTARVEVPAPTVEDIDAEDLDAEDVRDWREVADAVIEENASRFIVSATFDGEEVTGGTVNRKRWRRDRDGLVLDVLEASPGRPEISAVSSYLDNAIEDRAEAYREEARAGE